MPAPVLLGLAANRSRVYNPLAYGERISLLALKAPGDHRGSWIGPESSPKPRLREWYFLEVLRPPFPHVK
jgi:hypothetical protein